MVHGTWHIEHANDGNEIAFPPCNSLRENLSKNTSARPDQFPQAVIIEMETFMLEAGKAFVPLYA
jgi:hypothetical protein